MDKQITPLSHVGAVCALKFHKSELLAAHGPLLKIHNYQTEKEDEATLFQRKVIQKNKIHGIALGEEGKQQANKETDNTPIALWGGRDLVLSTISEIKDLDQPIQQLGVGDWIMYAEFSKDSALLYVLTAHNVVVTIDVASRKLVSLRDCGEKSILYSGSITVLDNGKILVCSGTVMSGILLWELNEQKLLHNLTGHEGSIFGIKASSDGKYLVSCSDDRSIKIWDVQSGENIATGWGHGARIWYLEFFKLASDEEEGSFRVISASEDCTVRLWKFEKDTLESYNIFDCHVGRNIWSGAVNKDTFIAATGGADGRIKLHDLYESSRDQFKMNQWELSDVVPTPGKSEGFKEYFDFGSGLITVTASGKVCILKNNYSKWVVEYEDEDLMNLSFTRGFQESRIACIGSKTGNVTLIKFDEEGEIVLKSSFKEDSFSSKVSNLLVSENDKKLMVFLESPNPKDQFSVRAVDYETLEVSNTYYFDKPESRFNSTCFAYSAANDWVIIGSRYVTFYLYDLSKQRAKLWKKFAPGDTISQIEVLSQENNEFEQHVTFLMTLRDGDYFILKIDQNYELTNIQDNRIQRGFLEGSFVDKNGDMFIFGFKSNVFFIWNETKQFEILKEPCGGAHRQWNLKYFYDILGKIHFRFFYTRNGVLNMLQTGSYPYNSKAYVTAGFHGRELRSLALCPVQNKDGSRLLISGAEDTTVRLSSIDREGNLKLFWSERKHVSGLQQVKFINNEFAITSAAREELFLWKVTPDLMNFNYISCYATLPPVSANPDLRIMDFDTIEVVSTEGAVIGFVMVTVYSDSAIKVWYFDYGKKDFSFLFETYYTTCCILNTRLLVSKSSVYISTVATDGHLSIWGISNSLKTMGFVSVVDSSKLILVGEINTDSTNCKVDLIVKQQIHQSSIKDFDIAYISDTIKVVTGGDDNALVLSTLSFPSEGEVDLSIDSFEASAAASTITGVEILPCGTKVLVTSVDQIVKLWSIENDEIELLTEKYTTVADTGCCSVTTFDDEVVGLIGGSGFCCWKL